MSGNVQYPMATYGNAGYGATPAYADFQTTSLDGKPPFGYGQQRRSVSPAILAASFGLPWILFAVVFTFEFLPLHYQTPQVVNLIVLASALVCVGLYAVAFNAWRRRFEGIDPYWFIFIAVTATLAVASGLVAGLKNFEDNMVPYMDVSNLNVYTGIDASTYTGAQLMDAGVVAFTTGSTLSISKSMGFKNLETYCVAPIVSNASAKPGSYDFWAVGLNCCSGHLADFHCGEFSNPNAISGVRLMREDYRKYFRLAVQQAEAAYNIKAEHPVFFYWLQDPSSEISAYQEDAYRIFLLGLGVSVGVQLVFVAIGLALYKS